MSAVFCWGRAIMSYDGRAFEIYAYMYVCTYILVLSEIGHIYYKIISFSAEYRYAFM